MYKDEKFWDRIAVKFDVIEKNDTAYYIFLEKILAYLKANDTILDFGCGTGRICIEIADSVDIIHAIDISSKMIEICINKASKRKINNINFYRTTLFENTFEDDFFDTVIAYNIFHLLEKPQKHFERIYQLLKPGGLLISNTPCMSEAPFLNRILKISSHAGLTPKLTAFTSTELKQSLINAAFTIIELNKIKPKSPQYICIAVK